MSLTRRAENPHMYAAKDCAHLSDSTCSFYQRQLMPCLALVSTSFFFFFLTFYSCNYIYIYFGRLA